MITLWELFCKVYDKQANDDMRNFLGSFIVDKWIIINKMKLFYTPMEKNTETVFKVFDEKRFEKFKHEDWQDIELSFSWWVITEFFKAETIHLMLPVNESEWVKDITTNFITYFLWPLARSKTIDDLYYMVIKQLANALWIYYDFHKRTIWFWVKPKSKFLIWNWKRISYSARTYSLEEVLKAEIKQWFVNKDIWDPSREYWYTHALREYAKFELTDWWKNILINWNRFNVVAATRWQWKTYFASLVAARALLDSRPWFWWRNYREIKYFVPNKEDVGTQVMEYIKSFLWDLVNFKLPHWKKAFEIKWNNYIKCNIK